MKKLTLLVTLLIGAFISNAQNTLNISGNTIETIVTSTGKTLWKSTNVNYLQKNPSDSSYTIGNGASTNKIFYKSTSYVVVNIASAVVPYSYDSLFNLIKVNITSLSGGGGGGGGNVVVTSSVLPTNAAQESGGNLAAAAASLASIDLGIPASLGQKSMSASMPVALASDQSAITTTITGTVPLPSGAATAVGISQLHADLIAALPSGQNSIGTVGGTDIRVNGTITAASQSVQVLTTGISSAYATLSGTWSGSIQFQGLQSDSAQWVPLSAVTGGLSGAYTTTATTSTGGYRIALPAGFKGLRAYSTAWTSGTALVYWNTSNGTANSEVVQFNPANLSANVYVQGTVPTVTTLTTLANGQTASGSAATGSPLRIGATVNPTTLATIPVNLTAGWAYNIPLTTGSQLPQKPYSDALFDFTFNVASALSTTSVQQIIPASSQASIRNYVTSLSYQTDAPGSAGNAWVLDGSVAGSSVTIATPGVFTSATHDLRVGDAIVFTSLGTITGVSTNTIYYVTSTSFAATTFTVASTQGGAALQITGSTSAFTFYRVLYQIRLQTTAIGTPAVLTFPTPLRPQPNAAVNLFIPVSLTSGNIYLTPSGYRGY